MASVPHRRARRNTVGHTQRKVIPGTTYLITRRCAGRRFYLRPDPVTTHIIAYCLARACRMTGVRVHAICAMSNHLHLVVTDVRGLLPQFAARLFREIAMCIKAHRGVCERVWAAGSYSAVELMTERAVVGKIVYTIANPVTAGLVRTVKEWPGLVSLPGAMHGTVALKGERPAWFDAKQSDVEDLQLCVPPCLAGRDRDDLVAAIKDEVEAREKAAAAELRKTGRRVLGADAVRATNPFDAPSTAELERQRNPTFAAMSRDAHREALRALRDWRRAYREALAAWRNGQRDAEFPAGTWWMVRFAGAKVAPPLAA